MTDADRQLIELITQQVLSILQQRGPSVATNATTGGVRSDAPAAIAPPIGVCTGDYSQFPELAGRRVGAQPRQASPASGASATSNANHAPVLKGIITADQLQEAMDTSSDRIARLAADARLTPLANDLTRQYPQRVVRMSAGEAMSAGNTATKMSSAWLWWAEGPCSSVDAVVAEQRDTLRPITARRSACALPQVVRELAAAVRDGRAAGGVLFVATAARAMCMANRCPSLRAVLGTCDKAVEQGITELGANVLVIEYPTFGKRAMRAMVERFIAQTPQPPAAIEQMLTELQRCG